MNNFKSGSLPLISWVVSGSLSSVYDCYLLVVVS